MKSLSLTKPLMIVVVGLPGSGKSFFARQFSETFSAPHISYDRLRHLIYGSGGFNKEEQKKIDAVAYSEVDELLKTRKTFVLDGIGVGKMQRIELRRKATKAGYDVLLVWVQTDEPTAKYRSMKRSRNKKDDVYNPSLSGSHYELLVNKFSAPAKNESHVVVSGKHTYATQAKVVLKRLVAPREEAASRQIVNHSNRAPNAVQPRRNVIIR